MLVIGCTVSLMSWGRGRCTQPTPWECCVLPVQPVWNWEHWGGGRHLSLGKESPTPCAVTEGGQSSVGWHGGDTSVPAPPNTSARLWQTGLWHPHRAGLSCANPPGVWTAGVRSRTASYCRLTWHGTDSSARAILLSEELSQAPVQCWRSCTQLRCCAESNQIPERCPWYLLESSYQFQAHNYILQHKIHYCSWINCSSGCRMPLCTVQPSLCLQIQGQSRCIC